MSRMTKSIFDVWLCEKEMRDNYIICRADLIAMNIKTVYKYFNNNHKYSYEEICNMTDDIIVLTDTEKKLLNRCVDKLLKKNYKLEIVDKDKLVLKKFRNS